MIYRSSLWREMFLLQTPLSLPFVIVTHLAYSGPSVPVQGLNSKASRVTTSPSDPVKLSGMVQSASGKTPSGGQDPFFLATTWFCKKLGKARRQRKYDLDSMINVAGLVLLIMHVSNARNGVRYSWRVCAVVRPFMMIR